MKKLNVQVVHIWTKLFLHLNDNSIEKFFYDFLKEQNVKVEVESNQVLNSIEDGEKNVISAKNK